MLLAGCAAPAELVVEPAAVESSLAARTPSASLVGATLALANLAQIELTPPDEAALADPGSDGFWHGCAYAFEPRVRAARRALLAARGLAEYAGAPAPVWVQLESDDLTSGPAIDQLKMSFDLVGLLGLGPAQAEREVARANELRAAAALEEALWVARFEVDRARARLAAARALVAALDAADAAAAPDRARVLLLEERGWFAGAELEIARAQLAGLESARSRARAAEAEARAALANASGLLSTNPALDAVTPALLEKLARIEAPPPPAPDAPLAASHPRLRVLRLSCAESEARVRRAAAGAWPGIALGPKLVFPGDGTSVGGLLQLRLPFPASWRGELAAAEEARARALEAYEEGTLAQLAALDASVVARSEARGRLEGPTSESIAAARAAWRAASASFRVQRARLEQWNMALQQLLFALRLEVSDRELSALSALDQAQARGPLLAQVAEVQP